MLLANCDHLWSYPVMKQVGIAELKSRLSEFLRVVQGGESIAVLDRNRTVAHIVPILERSGLRIRKPATDSPKPNKVSLPKSLAQKIDIVELLLEERQSHR
jgi:antitoxin (DNA-binding transcriptional repressor) of toxin-antitoxin stability system